MDFLTTEPKFLDSAVVGPLPATWSGVGMPDGDGWPFHRAPVGSVYKEVNHGEGWTRTWTKVKDDARDDDWATRHVLKQRVSYTEFTGVSAVGTLDLVQKIPAGAWVQQALLRDVVGFAGDVSATVQLGDGTTVARYSTGTPSVFATAAIIDPGVPSGVRVHVAEVTPRVTITVDAAWASVNAGAMTVEIWYLR